MATSKTTSDPFTIEVIKDALAAVGDEMFVTLLRTSMSPIIYEVLDFATGLTDAKARLVTQGQGVTGFIGMLSTSVEAVLDKWEGRLEPGDIVVTNDPYIGGGSHLSDVSLVAPIFVDGRLVAFAASKAHWSEVGGMSPGSFTTDSTDIYQEGLQFPCVKIWSRGERNEALVDMIASNVRTPSQTIGDLMAQAAAMRVGERAFREVCDKYGVDAVLESIDALIEHGEVIARLELAKLPKGEFHAKDYVDDDGLGNGPFEVRVKVTITDDEFICDFSGSHPQVAGPVNNTSTGLLSSAQVAFKALTNAEGGANHGSFAPLRVICPPGIDPLRRAPRALLHLLGVADLRRGADLAGDGAAPPGAARRGPHGVRSAARSSPARTPTPATSWCSSSRRSAAGARTPRATASSASSAASTARRS